MRLPQPSKVGRCIPLAELIFTVAGQLALLLLVEQLLLAEECMCHAVPLCTPISYQKECSC